MRFVVWGTGPSNTPAILEGVGSQIALETATENGFRENESWIPEDWAVEIEGPPDIEQWLRRDPTVKGFKHLKPEEGYPEETAD